MKDRIGRYSIIRELGRGGMATVYLANDPNFGRNVAIKVLPSQFLHDPQFRARFQREAKTIAALEHPAIVPVYDFGEEDEQPYIVMRYMQGGDLSHKLKDGALPVEQVAIIVARLANALDSAHNKGIIHRDLKPGNILFDQYDHAYLSDFGIVKLKEQNATFTGNAIIGTPTYMSPEQAKGDKDIDGRSDLYALGVIIYEMLAGVVPYQGNTPVKQMMQHIMDPVPRILDVNGDLPPEIGRIVSRAMAKEPDDRYPNSMALAAELSMAAGVGSAFHRLPPRDAAPSQPDAPPERFGTILDASAFEDEDAWVEPPVGSHTVLDDAAFDEPPAAETPAVNRGTVLDDSAFDDEPPVWDEAQPVNLRTVLDDAAYEEEPPFDSASPMGATVLEDSDAGYTVLDDDDVFGVFGEGDSAEPDELFAPAEPAADDWLTLSPTPKPQRPPRRLTPTPQPSPPPQPLPAAPTKKDPPIALIVGGIVGILLLLGGIWFFLPGSDEPEVAATPTSAIVAEVTEQPTEPPTEVAIVEPTEVPTEAPTPEPFLPVPGDVGGGGSLIAFQTQGAGGWNIGVMKLDGSNRVILTDDSSNDQRPRWSPDGKWITFRSDRGGNEDVWMMRPDGSEVQQLTTNPRADHTGTFSPDGMQLVYHADFDGEGVASIAVMPAAGGEPTRLTTIEDGNSFWASWSADGERIAFWTLRNDDKAELYVMNADGSNQRPLLKNNGAYLDPIWSPVTDEVAYYAYGESGRAELHIISAESKQIRRVETSLIANNILGDWSPDGEWLLLHSDFNGPDDIYMVRKDGSEERRVTNTASSDQHPVWQPISRAPRPLEVVAGAPASGELTVWHAFAGEQLAIFERAFETFEAQNPGVVISAEFIEREALKARFAAASADGTAPDIVIAPVDWGGEFVANGYVQDPAPFVPDSDLRRIGEQNLQNVQYRHDIVGMPVTARGIVLMRNATIFPEPFATLDEIIALDRSLFVLERGPYYSGATLNALGGQLMDDEGNPTFNDAAGLAWMNAVDRFNDRHSYGDQDIEAFERGEVGLIMDATWNIGRVANAIGRENLVIDPWPANMSGYVIYDVAYVNANLDADLRPAVSAFLSSLVAEPVQTALASRGNVPVVSDARVDLVHVQQALVVFEAGQPLPIAPEMALYWGPLTTAISNVFDLTADLQTELDKAAAEIASQLP